MPQQSKGSIRISPTDISKLGNFVNKAMKKERDVLLRNITNVTNVVYRTARAKRPLITAKEAKMTGRNRRVSDPNATYGVPVDTTSLQSAISMKVDDTGSKIQGIVYVDGSKNNSRTGVPVSQYAAAMEFGTSKIPARSFMRSSLQINKEFIRNRLKKQ